ncbi:MAG: hypothetical protein J6S14_05015 [Clostridia bacterium]|nr:hypothetical protein [Clostridia bacterium]
MENNENFVIEEEVTENTEQTVEETQPQTTEKTYTQEEVDAIVGRKKARWEAKQRRETEREYDGHRELLETLRAGTGKENASARELSEAFGQFYAEKGRIKKNPSPSPSYSAKDIEVLAKAEVEDIISAGYDEVVEEVDRLANLDESRMTAKDKAVFKALAEHRQKAERDRELSKIGVTADVYESEDFKNFASKFNSNIPITDIWDIYNKTIPKKELKTAGSMKQTQHEGVKDYYTPEEIERLTEEELDDPRVWEAVRRSMTGR